MKKFLFTLAALLIAGSAMADTHSYLYVDDMTITAEQNVPGTMIQVLVKGSFDARVSAFDVNIEFPEGTPLFNNGYIRPGTDLTISWTTFFGDTQSASAGLQGNANHTIAAFTAAGYENGALDSYGVAKWEAGDYENMYSFYFLVPEGGLKSFTFTTASAVSAGQDSRGGIVDAAQANERIVHTTTVTVEQAQEPAPAATISNEGNVVTAAVADHTVELYIVTTNDEGEEVLTKVDNPYTVPQTFSEQKLTFKALTKANEGESEDTWSEPTEITIPAKADKVAPAPTIANNNGVVTATCANHEVVLYVKNGDNWDVVEGGSFPLPANNTFDDVTYEFKAYTVANGTDDNINSDDVFADFTVPGKDSKKAPAPTIANNNGVVTATCDNHEVVLYVKNGENWDVVEDGSFELPENNTYEDVTYYFKAYTKANGTDDNLPSDEVFADFTVPGKQMDQAVKPKITFTPDNGGVTVKIEDYTEYTIKVNGTQVDPTRNEHNYYVEKGDVDKHIVVYAKNAPENMIAADTTATYVLAAKKVYEVPAPTISVNNSDPTQTVITIKATEGDLTYTLTDEDGNVIPASDYTVAATDNEVVITFENGDETQFVTVTATTNLTEVPEGYDEVQPGKATLPVEIPMKPQQPEQTEMPTIDVSFGGDTGSHYALVTFVNNDDAPVVIEYCIGYPENDDDWITYTGAPVTISTYGTYVIYARAKAEGKTMSVVNERSFTLDDDATSVNELVNGKTVAGVRYFNMAGQEMQEANGITIVVTTYTDGTTSAVKVIK